MRKNLTTFINSLSQAQGSKLYPDVHAPNQCNFFDMTANGIASMLNNYNEHYHATVEKQDKNSDNNGNIEYEESDSDINSLGPIPMDESTEYLHIMVTSGEDQCSKAKMPDVLEKL